MKKNSPRQLAIALHEATKKSDGTELSIILRNFVESLAAQRKIKSAEKIIKEFVSYSKERNGIVDIAITSANKLDQHTVKNIEKVFGGKVESSESIDKSLIGGIIIRTKEHILDASIKTQLNKLKQSLV